MALETDNSTDSLFVCFSTSCDPMIFGIEITVELKINLMQANCGSNDYASIFSDAVYVLIIKFGYSIWKQMCI